jgi:hypothetical protein
VERGVDVGVLAPRDAGAMTLIFAAALLLAPAVRVLDSWQAPPKAAGLAG